MSLAHTRKLLVKHPLRHAFEEIALADKAYRRMVEISVGDFTEYERAWRDFLGHLEKFWTKTQAAVHDLPGWKKIESEICHLRKTDPILSYLQHARNADEHSIQELASDWDAKLTAAQIGTEVHISWQPWDRPLLPVRNRGVTYNPPRSHLDKSIEPLLGKGKAEPRVIAELALAFYVNFFNRVSGEVVGTKCDTSQVAPSK